jgi:hypothetical protein
MLGAVVVGGGIVASDVFVNEGISCGGEEWVSLSLSCLTEWLNDVLLSRMGGVVDHWLSCAELCESLSCCGGDAFDDFFFDEPLLLLDFDSFLFVDSLVESLPELLVLSLFFSFV